MHLVKTTALMVVGLQLTFVGNVLAAEQPGADSNLWQLQAGVSNPFIFDCVVALQNKQAQPYSPPDNGGMRTSQGAGTR